MEAERLAKALDEHRKWLEGYEDGRANLRDANLCGANLCDADLRDADLRDADLRDADLCDADLRGANLRDANLRYADLRGANLRGANLCDANLRYADLRGVNLCGANLCDASLRYVDLRGATLAWTSHELIGELLRQWSQGSTERRILAGVVLVSRDWCWKELVGLRLPGTDDALDHLSALVRDGDYAPEVLRMPWTTYQR